MARGPRVLVWCDGYRYDEDAYQPDKGTGTDTFSPERMVAAVLATAGHAVVTTHIRFASPCSGEPADCGLLGESGR